MSRMGSIVRAGALVAAALVVAGPRLATQEPGPPRRLKTAGTALPAHRPRPVATRGAPRGDRRPRAGGRSRPGDALGRGALDGEVPRPGPRRDRRHRSGRRCRGGRPPLRRPRRRRVRAAGLPRALRLPPERSAVRAPMEPERAADGARLGRQPGRDERDHRRRPRRRRRLRHGDLHLQRLRGGDRLAPLPRPRTGRRSPSRPRRSSPGRTASSRRATSSGTTTRRSTSTATARTSPAPSASSPTTASASPAWRSTCAHAGQGDRRRLGLHLRRPERGDDVGRGERHPLRRRQRRPRHQHEHRLRGRPDRCRRSRRRCVTR